MEGNNVFFWCIMLFYFRKGKNATQTRKKIYVVYGEDAISDRMSQKWFAKFYSGEMNIEDALRSGRPVTTDVDQITALIDSDRQITVREIAARLNIGKSTVSEHLNKLQIIKKLDVWVPHDLTEKYWSISDFHQWFAIQMQRIRSIFEAYHNRRRKVDNL